MALILDTGPLYATLDRSDKDHFPCRKLLQDWKKNREKLIIPAPILPEVDYFVGKQLGVGIMLRLLKDIQSGGFLIEDLLPDDYRRVEELMDRYSDTKIGFVDASVMTIAERLGEVQIATLDRRHFSMVRPRHADAFVLLPVV
ncbi:MAG: type II toxin-antitoxin system VapC family toxin [Candidatus Dormibacteraceae bacterium]